MRKLILSVFIFLTLFIFVSVASAEENSIDIKNFQKFLCKILNSYDIVNEMEEYGEITESIKLVQSKTAKKYGRPPKKSYEYVLKTNNFVINYRYMYDDRDNKNFAHTFTIKNKKGDFFKNLSASRQWLSQFGEILVNDYDIAAVQKYDSYLGYDRKDYSNYFWSISTTSYGSDQIEICWDSIEFQHFNDQFCNTGE